MGEWIERIGWPRFFELAASLPEAPSRYVDGARKTMTMSAHVHF
jgi:sulfite reductase beta subunit